MEALAGQKSPISGAVNEYYTHRRRVNTLLLGQIQRTFDLDGFTGDRTLGCRKGSRVSREDEELGKYGHADSDDMEGEDADDIENDQINGILDFVTSL